MSRLYCEVVDERFKSILGDVGGATKKVRHGALPNGVPVDWERRYKAVSLWLLPELVPPDWPGEKVDYPPNIGRKGRNSNLSRALRGVPVVRLKVTPELLDAAAAHLTSLCRARRAVA